MFSWSYQLGFFGNCGKGEKNSNKKGINNKL